MSDVDNSWKPPTLASFFHSFPHYDLGDNQVSNAYNIHSYSYRESLYVIGSVHLTWLYLILLSMAIYLMYRWFFRRPLDGYRPEYTKWPRKLLLYAICLTLICLLLEIILHLMLMSNMKVNELPNLTHKYEFPTVKEDVAPHLKEFMFKQQYVIYNMRYWGADQRYRNTNPPPLDKDFPLSAWTGNQYYDENPDDSAKNRVAAGATAAAIPDEYDRLISRSLQILNMTLKNKTFTFRQPEEKDSDHPLQLLYKEVEPWNMLAYFLFIWLSLLTFLCLGIYSIRYDEFFWVPVFFALWMSCIAAVSLTILAVAIGDACQDLEKTAVFIDNAVMVTVKENHCTKWTQKLIKAVDNLIQDYNVMLYEKFQGFYGSVHHYCSSCTRAENRFHRAAFRLAGYSRGEIFDDMFELREKMVDFQNKCPKHARIVQFDTQKTVQGFCEDDILLVPIFLQLILAIIIAMLLIPTLFIYISLRQCVLPAKMDDEKCAGKLKISKSWIADKKAKLVTSLRTEPPEILISKATKLCYSKCRQRVFKLKQKHQETDELKNYYMTEVATTDGIKKMIAESVEIQNENIGSPKTKGKYDNRNYAIKDEIEQRIKAPHKVERTPDDTKPIQHNPVGSVPQPSSPSNPQNQQHRDRCIPNTKYIQPPREPRPRLPVSVRKSNSREFKIACRVPTENVSTLRDPVVKCRTEYPGPTSKETSKRHKSMQNQKFAPTEDLALIKNMEQFENRRADLDPTSAHTDRRHGSKPYHSHHNNNQIPKEHPRSPMHFNTTPQARFVASKTMLPKQGKLSSNFTVSNSAPRSKPILKQMKTERDCNVRSKPSVRFLSHGKKNIEQYPLVNKFNIKSDLFSFTPTHSQEFSTILYSPVIESEKTPSSPQSPVEFDSSYLDSSPLPNIVTSTPSLDEITTCVESLHDEINNIPPCDKKPSSEALQILTCSSKKKDTAPQDEEHQQSLQALRTPSSSPDKNDNTPEYEDYKNSLEALRRRSLSPNKKVMRPQYENYKNNIEALQQRSGFPNKKNGTPQYEDYKNSLEALRRRSLSPNKKYRTPDERRSILPNKKETTPEYEEYKTSLEALRGRSISSNKKDKTPEDAKYETNMESLQRRSSPSNKKDKTPEYEQYKNYLEALRHRSGSSNTKDKTPEYMKYKTSLESLRRRSSSSNIKDKTPEYEKYKTSLEILRRPSGLSNKKDKTPEYEEYKTNLEALRRRSSSCNKNDKTPEYEKHKTSLASIRRRSCSSDKNDKTPEYEEYKTNVEALRRRSSSPDNKDKTPENEKYKTSLKALPVSGTSSNNKGKIPQYEDYKNSLEALRRRSSSPNNRVTNPQYEDKTHSLKARSCSQKKIDKLPQYEDFKNSLEALKRRSCSPNDHKNSSEVLQHHSCSSNKNDNKPQCEKCQGSIHSLDSLRQSSSSQSCGNAETIDNEASECVNCGCLITNSPQNLSPMQGESSRVKTSARRKPLDGLPHGKIKNHQATKNNIPQYEDYKHSLEVLRRCRCSSTRKDKTPPCDNYKNHLGEIQQHSFSPKKNDKTPQYESDSKNLQHSCCSPITKDKTPQHVNYHESFEDLRKPRCAPNKNKTDYKENLEALQKPSSSVAGEKTETTRSKASDNLTHEYKPLDSLPPKILGSAKGGCSPVKSNTNQLSSKDSTRDNKSINEGSLLPLKSPNTSPRVIDTFAEIFGEDAHISSRQKMIEDTVPCMSTPLDTTTCDCKEVGTPPVKLVEEKPNKKETSKIKDKTSQQRTFQRKPASTPCEYNTPQTPFVKVEQLPATNFGVRTSLIVLTPPISPKSSRVIKTRKNKIFKKHKSKSKDLKRDMKSCKKDIKCPPHCTASSRTMKEPQLTRQKLCNKEKGRRTVYLKVHSKSPTKQESDVEDN